MVQNYIKKINEIYEDYNDAKLTVLITYQTSLKKKIEKCDEMHEEIIQLLDDEEEMLTLEETYSEFKIDAENELLKLSRYINSRDDTNNDLLTNNSTKGNCVKLPKLEVKPFDGDPLQWKTFYDTFVCTVDNNETLSDVEKMSYLFNLLRGRAQQTVQGFSITNENYRKSLDLLKKTLWR